METVSTGTAVTGTAAAGTDAAGTKSTTWLVEPAMVKHQKPKAK